MWLVKIVISLLKVLHNLLERGQGCCPNHSLMRADLVASPNIQGVTFRSSKPWRRSPTKYTTSSSKFSPSFCMRKPSRPDAASRQRVRKLCLNPCGPSGVERCLHVKMSCIYAACLGYGAFNWRNRYYTWLLFFSRPVQQCSYVLLTDTRFRKNPPDFSR